MTMTYEYNYESQHWVTQYDYHCDYKLLSIVMKLTFDYHLSNSNTFAFIICDFIQANY